MKRRARSSAAAFRSALRRALSIEARHPLLDQRLEAFEIVNALELLGGDEHACLARVTLDEHGGKPLAGLVGESASKSGSQVKAGLDRQLGDEATPGRFLDEASVGEIAEATGISRRIDDAVDEVEKQRHRRRVYVVDEVQVGLVAIRSQFP